MMTLLALLALWWQTVGMKAMRILGIVMTAVALTLYAPALAMCCQQVDNYRYAVAQMKQPGVSIIQTRDVRPANTLERIAYERYVMPFADYGFSAATWGLTQRIAICAVRPVSTASRVCGFYPRI